MYILFQQGGFHPQPLYVFGKFHIILLYCQKIKPKINKRNRYAKTN